jgi:DNA polymerase-1
MRELLVLDGTALLFRAYYGSKRAFRSPDGVEVGAVLGVCHTVQRLLRWETPDRVAVVFDAGQRTFRNDLDPRYKAQRGSPPDDLKPQFDLARAAIDHLGLPAWTRPGFEADDLMATLARLAGETGRPCRLMSVDKDLCQLVYDGAPAVVVEDPHGGKVYDADGVRRRLGVPPSQVVDYMALIGDSSDNIPGVRGVGPKAAQALLEAFGDLDAIYRELHRVADLPVRGAKTLAAKLEAGREEALLARELVTLLDDVDMGIDDLDARTTWGGPGGEDAERFFEALGFLGPLRGMRALAL